MAVDMFLKLDDIKGESRDHAHKDAIEIMAWSWGMSHPGSSHQGGGSGTGKANVQDLSLTKFVDRSTPNLMVSLCNGKHFKEAKLTVRKAGEHPLEYLTISMEQVLVTSVSTGGSGGEERLSEHLTLNFAKFKVDYKPQKGTGGGDAAITKAWDISKNSEA
jgi:type VI secretion system secreted protein Hcp